MSFCNSACTRTLSSIYEHSIFVVPDPFVCVHDSKARWVSGNLCPDKHARLHPTWEAGDLCVGRKGEIPILTAELTLVSTGEALRWHVNEYNRSPATVFHVYCIYSFPSISRPVNSPRFPQSISHKIPGLQNTLYPPGAMNGSQLNNLDRSSIAL